jgi:CelD/BcsL family acetyltransferase involved in cellulose biosynthesis
MRPSPMGRLSPAPVGAGVCPSTTVSVQAVSDWEAFAALEPEWNALLRRSGADAIFLTWEWIQSWREAAGAGVRPLVLTARTGDGALVGAAPFYRTTLRLADVVPYRTLRVLGDHPTGAEYPDWIAAAEVAETVLRALAKALAARGDWDCLWMPRVSGWSGARERLTAAASAAGLRCHLRVKPFAAIPLPGTPQALWTQVSANQRSTLQRARAKVLGRPGVRFVACESPADLPRFLEALFRLHHRRWLLKGEEGTFRRNPEGARFYERFAPRAQACGWLRFYGLEEDGELKAVQVGYVYGGAFHQLQEGFDPEYAAGAGNVVRALALERCVAEGLHTYDFLGGSSEHKRRWGAQVRDGYDLFLGRRSLRTAPLFWRELWPSGRYLRPAGGGDCEGARGA